MKRKMLSVMLVLTMLLTLLVGAQGTAYADTMKKVNLQTTIDGGTPVILRAYYANYDNNLYINMRDLCKALNGTEKQMSMQSRYDDTLESTVFEMTTGEEYTPVGGENEPYDTTWGDDPTQGSDATNSTSFEYDSRHIYINGANKMYRVYYTYGDPSTNNFWMKLIDIGLAFDIPSTVSADGTTLTLSTKTPFRVDIEELDRNGYFTALPTLVGNATTGEILFTANENQIMALASTTKLMTFLLVQEAIERGDISLDTMVKLQQEAVAEANSPDASSPCKENFAVDKEVSIHDLLAGLLLPSANECGVALADAVSGSQAEFVKLMNQRCKELGLTTAEFFNPHGLPDYASSTFSGVRENHMNVQDMFKLVCYIMQNYADELTAFTSQHSIEVPTIEAGAKVTSSYEDALDNIDGCVGLKTGYTAKAGYCFVGGVRIEVAGETQYVVSLVYNTPNNREKYEKSMVLLRYGTDYYKTEVVATVNGVSYRTLQEAVDAVPNNGTIIIVSPDATSATLNRDASFTIKKDAAKAEELAGVDLTKLITQGSAYTMDVTVNEDQSVSIVCRNTYIPPTPGVGGGSTLPPAGTVQAPVITPNDTVDTQLSADGGTLTITPKDGYTIEDVTVNGVSKGAVNTVTGLKTGDVVEIKTVNPELQAQDARIKAGVEATTVKVSSKAVKNGIRLDWSRSKGFKVDYYEVYRSVKKSSGYGAVGKAAYYRTPNGSKTYYINTKELTKGQTYYYKVYGVRTLSTGEKVYTQRSNTAWRRATVNK